jgi:hypothetical protein
MASHIPLSPTEHHQLEKHDSIDPAATNQKLLADVNSANWLVGYTPDATAKLLKDGTLPNTHIFDPLHNMQHLSQDLNTYQAEGNNLQQMDKYIGDTQSSISGSAAADHAVVSDYQTVLKADPLFKDMIARDPNSINDPSLTLPQETVKAMMQYPDPAVAAAAARLYNNWDKISDFTGASAQPNSPAASHYADAPFINNSFEQNGLKMHDAGRQAETADLDHTRVIAQNIQDDRNTLAGSIGDEQKALAPTANFLAAAKIGKGEGYYQVASRVLNLDGHTHTEAERKQLTEYLKQQVAQERQVSKVNEPLKILTTKDMQMTPEALEALFVKMGGAAGSAAQS